MHEITCFLNEVKSNSHYEQCYVCSFINEFPLGAACNAMLDSRDKKTHIRCSPCPQGALRVHSSPRAYPNSFPNPCLWNFRKHILGILKSRMKFQNLIIKKISQRIIKSLGIIFHEILNQFQNSNLQKLTLLRKHICRENERS